MEYLKNWINYSILILKMGGNSPKERTRVKRYPIISIFMRYVEVTNLFISRLVFKKLFVIVAKFILFETFAIKVHTSLKAISWNLTYHQIKISKLNFFKL